MPVRNVDAANLQPDEDWEGNNVAFTCPHCDQVFIVSGMIHRGERSCPRCQRSTGYCQGGRRGGGNARIEW